MVINRRQLSWNQLLITLKMPIREESLRNPEVVAEQLNALKRKPLKQLLYLLLST